MILFVCLIFWMTNSSFASTKTNYIEVLNEARKGEDGSQNIIFFLKNEIEQGRTTYEKLKSSKKEFADLKRKGCHNTIARLESEMRDATVPLNEIFHLESTLVDCDMDYKEANINPQEIKQLERLSYAVLAKGAYLEYEKTKNSVFLNQNKRYMLWGQLTPKDIGLKDSDILALTDKK